MTLAHQSRVGKNMTSEGHACEAMLEYHWAQCDHHLMMLALMKVSDLEKLVRKENSSPGDLYTLTK